MRTRWLIRITAVVLLGGASAGILFQQKSERAASLRAQADRVAVLEAAGAGREARLRAASDGNRADAERLGARLAEAETGLSESRRAVEDAGRRIAQADQERTDAQRVRDTVQAELLAANDRLEKAYKDIAEMEKQLVDVSRSKNDVEMRLAELEAELDRLKPDRHPSKPLKIDGSVLGVSGKVNLVLISVGGKDKVRTGMKFTVYCGENFVSKLVVDKVEDGWAACKELTDFRKDGIQQGDSVSTRDWEEIEGPGK